jgi:hypothetical protein
VPLQRGILLLPKDAAVVYLARYHEGVEPIRRFIDSYRRFAAEAPHDLVIVWKGFPNHDGEGSPQKAVCNQVEHQSISISDDGFDLGAYRTAAELLAHGTLFFVNTFSEFLSSGWLRKLQSVLASTSVGIVGAMGSYQSLHDSLKEINKAIWLCGQHVPYDEDLAKRWGSEIIKHRPAWMKQTFIERALALLVPFFRRKDLLDQRYEAYWRSVTSPGGAVEWYAHFPEFPNPHIRTNAFMMDRMLFLDLCPSNMESKRETFEFESGISSLTALLLRRGLRSVVVGDDGVGYEIENWPKSRTFRLGQQENLLVADNQTRTFDAMTWHERDAHVEMTWGAKVFVQSQISQVAIPPD